MINIRQTHDMLIRQVEATRIVLEALEVAELAARWVCQAENVVNVSRIGLPSLRDRHAALNHATEAARQAADHAEETRKAAAQGRIEDARKALVKVSQRELAVRRFAQNAGLNVNDGNVLQTPQQEWD
jgi:hypothetical protein